MSCPIYLLLLQASSPTSVNLKSLSSASGTVSESDLLLLFPTLLLTLPYISGSFLLHGVCSGGGKSWESRRERTPALSFGAPIHGLEEPELQLKWKSCSPLGWQVHSADGFQQIFRKPSCGALLRLSFYKNRCAGLTAQCQQGWGLPTSSSWGPATTLYLSPALVSQTYFWSLSEN